MARSKICALASGRSGERSFFIFAEVCGFGGKVSWRRFQKVMGNSKWSHFSISQWEPLNGLITEGTLPALARPCKDANSLDIDDKASNRSIVSTFSPSEHFRNLKWADQTDGYFFSFFLYFFTTQDKIEEVKGQAGRQAWEDRARGRQVMLILSVHCFREVWMELERVWMTCWHHMADTVAEFGGPIWWMIKHRRKEHRTLDGWLLN